MLSFFLAGLAGLTLGLLGGGGSILTVPILVYVAAIDPKVSVAMSLAIVGITTLFGVYGHYRSKNINLKLAFFFSATAIPATFLGSYLSLFITGSLQLTIFSVVMITAAGFMLKDKKPLDETQVSQNLSMTLLSGIFVGTLTGLIGVGGGFLIVPALMYFTGTDIKRSVGTSLFIISLNSFFGFLSYIGKVEIPWLFMGKFTLCSIFGIIIGARLVPYISQKILK